MTFNEQMAQKPFKDFKETMLEEVRSDHGECGVELIEDATTFQELFEGAKRLEDDFWMDLCGERC